MDKQEREDRMRRAEAKRKEDEAKRKADLEEKQRAKEERTKKQMAAAQQKIATAAAAASNGLTGTARLELDKGKPVNNPISSKVCLSLGCSLFEYGKQGRTSTQQMPVCNKGLWCMFMVLLIHRPLHTAPQQCKTADTSYSCLWHAG